MIKLFLILYVVSLCLSVKFDLQSEPAGKSLCLTQYIAKDTLVSVSAAISSVDTDDTTSQKIGIKIGDTTGKGNEYFSRPSIVDDNFKYAFTSHEWGDIEFCFTNTLEKGKFPSVELFKTIHLHIDTGAEAADYSETAKREKLSDLEAELLRMEEEVVELNNELAYMHSREYGLRDTNEDANSRVKNFSFLSMLVIIAVGVWQVWYLRQFFQSKKLI